MSCTCVPNLVLLPQNARFTHIRSLSGDCGRIPIRFFGSRFIQLTHSGTCIRSWFISSGHWVSSTRVILLRAFSRASTYSMWCHILHLRKLFHFRNYQVFLIIRNNIRENVSGYKIYRLISNYCRKLADLTPWGSWFSQFKIQMKLIYTSCQI